MSGSRRSSVLDIFGGGLRFFANLSTANFLRLTLSGVPATSIDWKLPVTLPANTQALTINQNGDIGFQALGGGGTVTNLVLGASADVLFSVATSNTTPTLTLDSQSANTLLIAPNGAAGAPTFRALVYGDLSSLVGTAANTLAAGNDSRFHTQHTDSGTTQTAFQLDSGNNGPRLKNSSGTLQIRNGADTAFADLTANNLTVQNLTVSGTTVTVSSETVLIADNIVTLNSNFTSGTPTEDAGHEVYRGGSASARLIWDESADAWKAGIVGAEYFISRNRVISFTNANLTAGTIVINHNLGNQYPSGIMIWDNNGKPWATIDDITATDANNLTLDLTSVVAANGGTLPGTWRCSVNS